MTDLEKDVETVRQALQWHIDCSSPLNVPGREGDLEAFERIAARALESPKST